MSDEREKKLAQATDEKLADVEAHRKAAKAADEPEASDDEPDVEAHRIMGRSRLER